MAGMMDKGKYLQRQEGFLLRPSAAGMTDNSEYPQR